MSDEANWAAAVTTEANDHAVTPFAAGDDNTPVTYADNMSTAQTFAAGFANRFTRVATVGAVAWAIPIAETVVSVVTKTDAETWAAEIDATTDIGIGCAAGGSKRAHGKGAGDKN